MRERRVIGAILFRHRVADIQLTLVKVYDIIFIESERGVLPMKRMSKQDYVDSIAVAKNLLDKGALMCEALGVECCDDIMTNSADHILDMAAILVGDMGLPLSLDSDRVMRECGNDLPLTIWWAVVANYDAVDLNIEGEIVTISTAADLYDLIVRLYPEN